MERTVASREVFAGRLLHVRVDTVELEGGRTATREIVEHPGAVAVLALTDDRQLVLVQQYRKPAERVTLEIPAGTLDAGEAPEACAVRELKEETGYSAGSIRKICSFYTAVGFCTEVLHLFVAEQLTPGSPSTEDDENIAVLTTPVEAAMDMIHNGQIVDSKTVAGVFWAELLLAGNPRALVLGQGRAA